MPDKRRVVDNLVGALRLMASPYDAQVAALPPSVALPDEVGLLFEDAYRVLEADLLPVVVRPHLARIADRLQAMEERPREDLWTADALRNAPDWEELRRDAMASLNAWGIEPSAVTVDPGNYVVGPWWHRKQP
jgi:hypothetical protein